MDRDYYNTSLRNWSVSSPQHIPGNVVEILFGKEFFSEYFAVLREPIDRFKSAFLFQKYKEKNIQEEFNCNYFVKEVLVNNYLRQGWCDNHFQPQITFLVPNKNYKLFEMNKNGMKNLKKYIDNVILKTNLDIHFPRDNKKNLSIDIDKGDIILDSHSIKILNEIYKEDFDLFRKIKQNESDYKKEVTVTGTQKFNFNEIKFSSTHIEKLQLEHETLKINYRELKKNLNKIQDSSLWKFLMLPKKIKNKLKTIIFKRK